MHTKMKIIAKPTFFSFVCQQKYTMINGTN